MNAVNTKRQNLELMRWLIRIPQIATAQEAYRQQRDNQQTFLVAWWGDIPVGFTRFEFQALTTEGYAVICKHEEQPDTYIDILLDDLVLIFSD